MNLIVRVRRSATLRSMALSVRSLSRRTRTVRNAKLAKRRHASQPAESIEVRIEHEQLQDLLSLRKFSPQPVDQIEPRFSAGVARGTPDRTELPRRSKLRRKNRSCNPQQHRHALFQKSLSSVCGHRFILDRLVLMLESAFAGDASKTHYGCSAMLMRARIETPTPRSDASSD